MSAKHQSKNQKPGNLVTKPTGSAVSADAPQSTLTPAKFPRQHVHLLRITLQLESPLALGSGHATSEFDSPCALDANGLPYLPGTSLAGSLRSWLSALTLTNGKAATADDWFGYVDVDERSGQGLTSPLRLTAGHIHNARNQVQDGRVLQLEWQRDPILGPITTSLPYREHVRLNHRGVAADTGKFDRSFVPRGHRFTFQMQINPYPGESVAWPELREKLLTALTGGEVCLGSAQRAGFGRVRAVQAWGTSVDLREADQRKGLLAWRKLDVEPPANSKLNLNHFAGRVQLGAAADSKLASLSRGIDLALQLSACDYWRVGSASNGLRAPGLNTDVSDDQPYREQFVDWVPVPAALNHNWVVPGSALKGALAHRTTFHLNRLEGRWAGQEGALAPLEAVHTLFGIEANESQHPSTQNVASAHDGTQARGAGALWVDDAIPYATPAPEVARFNHVRLDRFTGGAYGGALFSEDALFGGAITVRLRVRPASLRYLCPDAATRQRVLKALGLALADLADSRLGIGADVANGLGYFQAGDRTRVNAQLQQFEHDILAALDASAHARVHDAEHSEATA